MDFVFLILWVCLGSSEDDESGFTTCHFKWNWRKALNCLL